MGDRDHDHKLDHGDRQAHEHVHIYPIEIYGEHLQIFGGYIERKNHFRNFAAKIEDEIKQ